MGYRMLRMNLCLLLCFEYVLLFHAGCSREVPKPVKAVPSMGKLSVNGRSFDSGEVIPLNRGVEMTFSARLSPDKVTVLGNGGVVHFDRAGLIVTSTSFPRAKLGSDGRYIRFKIKLPDDLEPGELKITFRGKGKAVAQSLARVE